MARKSKRKASDKKSAIDKKIQTIRDSSGGNVSEDLDALLGLIREEEEKKEEDFLDVDNLLKELEKSRKRDAAQKKKEAAQKKKTSALVKRVSDKKEKSKEEEIDPRILELLGLDFIDDLDYEEYELLLKEKTQKLKNNISDEDRALLSNERKRVRGSKGSFSQKKPKKVKTSNFVSKKPKEKPTQEQKVQTDKLLPPSSESSKKVENIKAEVKEENQEQLIPLSNSLTDIEKNLNQILKVNQQKLEIDKQAAKDLETKEENEAFKKKEAQLESKKPVVSEKIKRTLAPAKGIFDMITNFFSNVLMGGAVQLLLDIVNNPNKYLKPLIDFGNTFVDYMNGFVKFVNDYLLFPVNIQIKVLNSAFNEIEYALKQIGRIIPGLGKTKLPDIPELKIPNIPQIPSNLIQQQEGGGTVIDIKNLSLFDGGAIDGKSGLRIKGLGKDTQLIAAQPGEIMMSKKAVEAYGAKNLLAANALAGGTNKPKFGNIQGFEGGGQVGKLVIGAGHSPSEENAMKGLALGSDGRPVQGTSQFANGGVPEWRATRHLVKTMRQLVGQNKALSSMISFENITAYKGKKGLRGLPGRVESTQGSQFIDLHFDARGGRSGVLNPHSNKISSVDKSMASVFGNYPGVPVEAKGVTAAGGTILEVAAIDDPAIAMYLGEVSQGKVGKHSLALANRVLGSMLPGLKGGGSISQPSPNLLNMFSNAGSKEAQSIQAKLNRGTSPTVVQPSGSSVRVPGPPVTMGGGGTTAVLPVPVSQQVPSSGSSASQAKVPNFGAEDTSNYDLIVVKSIYNIVG
jgi:hypothetical protein